MGTTQLSWDCVASVVGQGVDSECGRSVKVAARHLRLEKTKAANNTSIAPLS
jgi:hypothetical protein